MKKNKKDRNKTIQMIVLIPSSIFLVALTLAVNSNSKIFPYYILVGIISLIITFLIGFCFIKRRKPLTFSPKNQYKNKYNKLNHQLLPTKKDLFILFSKYNVDVTNELLDFYLACLQTSNLNYDIQLNTNLTKEEIIFAKNVYNCLNNWTHIEFLLKDKMELEQQYCIDNIIIPSNVILYIAFRKPIEKEYALKWQKILEEEIDIAYNTIKGTCNKYDISIKESCDFVSRLTMYKISDWAFYFAYKKRESIIS